MHSLNQTLRRQAIILTHRLMALDTLRLARTARECLDAGADEVPRALLETYEEDMAKRRQRIKVLTRL